MIELGQRTDLRFAVSLVTACVRVKAKNSVIPRAYLRTMESLEACVPVIVSEAAFCRTAVSFPSVGRVLLFKTLHLCSIKTPYARISRESIDRFVS